VYNGSVWTFSDMQYSQLSQDEKAALAGDSIIKTAPDMASPSITRYATVVVVIWCAGKDTLPSATLHVVQLYRL
jgi:hypothetical protein